MTGTPSPALTYLVNEEPKTMTGTYHLRTEDDDYDNEELFDLYPTLFSLNFHHGGSFTPTPGRQYVKGSLSLVDLLHVPRFCVSELDLIVKELGYNNVTSSYYFKDPNIDDLDLGIHPIVNDADVQNVIEVVNAGNRVIDVFVEHAPSNMDDEDVEPQSDEEENNMDDEDVEPQSDEDSDYIIDDDTRDFRFNIDLHAGETSLKVELDLDVLDTENFDSGSDSEEDLGSIRSRKLKLITRDHCDDSCSSFYLGQQFANKKDAKAFIRRHTIETKRELKTVKDDKVRLRVVCQGQMHGVDQVKVKSEKSTNSKVVDSKKRVETDKGTTSEGQRATSSRAEIKNKGGRGKRTNLHQYSCPWVLLVSKDSVTETWLVKTLNDTHKCLPSRNINALNSTFLSQQLMDQIEQNPNIPIRAVQEQFQKKFELPVSKMKAFRARSKAQKQLHGDYSSQYALLRDYCDELRLRNPGTTIKIEVEPVSDPNASTRQFKRIYICLGPLKEGFRAIGRDLLGLDGAFLKGPFPGQILSAVGVNPNNGIYPLSYALVEVENINSWTWFLECLGDDLDLTSTSNFTFISDRQKGILQAITKLYPAAEHRFCLRHIHENMKLSFKGKAFKDLLWRLATSTTVVQFEREMEELKKESTDAHLWVSKIPPKHWSRSHFSGRAHSDMLLNNMCEVFNSKIVDGRDKPIITALEYIREYLMRRIVNVLQVIDKSEGPLTPSASKLFAINKKEASKYVVTWNGGDEYEVSGPGGDQCVVNVVQNSCSCRRWEITGIPCKHAVATNHNMASHGQQVGIPETWVHKVYWLETWEKVYGYKIFPINGKSLWAKSQAPTTLTPPIHHKQVGRPKKKRKRSAVEDEDVSKKLSKKNITVTCSKCKQKGHNSRTCKGQRFDGEITKKGVTGQKGESAVVPKKQVKVVKAKKGKPAVESRKKVKDVKAKKG